MSMEDDFFALQDNLNRSIRSKDTNMCLSEDGNCVRRCQHKHEHSRHDQLALERQVSANEGKNHQNYDGCAHLSHRSDTKEHNKCKSLMWRNEDCDKNGEGQATGVVDNCCISVGDFLCEHHHNCDL